MLSLLLISALALAASPDDLKFTHDWAAKIIPAGQNQMEFAGEGSLTNFYDPCVLVVAKDYSGDIYLAVGLEVKDKTQERIAMVDGMADAISLRQAGPKRIEILSHHNEYIGTKEIPVRNNLLIKLDESGQPVQAIGFSSKFGQVDCRIGNNL